MSAMLGPEVEIVFLSPHCLDLSHQQSKNDKGLDWDLQKKLPGDHPL